MPCGVAVGYQHFGGLCCLHLQGEVNGAGRQHVPPKHWCPTVTLLGIVSQRTST